MATVKLKLDKRAQKQDGTYPVKIYVHHQGDFFLKTDISVRAEDWIGSDESPTTIKRHNSILIAMRDQIKSTLGELRVSRKLLSMDKNELKRALMIAQGGSANYDQPGEEAEAKPLLLRDAFKSFAESANTAGTKSIYLQTLAKLSKYYDLEVLEFGNITTTWLREFEAKMKADSMAINAMSVHLRNLRAVYNRAIDDELIDMAGYPFRKFKIKTEATVKRSITVDELRTLRDYPITELQEHQNKYRDMFMLIFYLIGINAVDLFGAKEINNGRLEFRRAKTGRLYSIKVEPEAAVIIEKYAGKNYLLDVCDNYGKYQDFLHRMNKNLKEIGEVEMVANAAKESKHVKQNKKSIKPLFPALSSYWARHTWATIAADLDIPDETISLALGHAGANSTTNIYINRNQRKVDDANRRVLDFVKSSESAADYLDRLAVEAMTKAAEAKSKLGAEVADEAEN